MKKIAIILNFVFVSSVGFAFETPRTPSLIESQIKLIHRGIIERTITPETAEFFLASIREMQNGKSADQGPVARFTELVSQGIALGLFTEETREFFLNAARELNEK